MDIAALGYEIDSSQAVGAAKNLDLMAARAANAEKAAIRLSGATRQAGGGLSSFGSSAVNIAGGTNRMSHAVTNASFQVQDFAVQLASGQSAMMAFAQQFPQLMGSLGFSGKAGLYGALIGTAAAIGVTLYQALNDTGAAADGFKKSIDALEDQVSSFRQATETALLPLDQLYEKFGSASPVLQQALADLAAIEKVKAYEAIDATSKSMVALVGYAGQWNAEANRINQSFLGFTVNSEEARIAAYNFNTELQRMASAQDPVDKLRAAVSLRDQLDKATGGYSKMNAEQKTMREGLSKVIVQLEMMGVRVDGTASAFEKVRINAAAAQGPISGLVGITNSLADAAWRAAGGIAAYAQGQADAASAAVFGPDVAPSVPSGLGNFGPNPLGQGLAPGTSPRPSARPTLQNDPNWGWSAASGGGGSGGGGGGTDPYEENLKRLIESLRTEREEVDAWYQESLTLLEDRRANELLGEQAHNDAKLALESEYLEKKRNLNDNYDQFSLSSADKLFGELYDLSGSGYEGLLRLQKTFGAAQALVNTYTAASQVLADPKLGYFAKFAAVAKTIAAGMGFVNAIKGGGGGSGSASATNSATSTGRAEPERVTRIELQGDDWLVSLAESMLDQIYDASKNGRVIVARA